MYVSTVPAADSSWCVDPSSRRRIRVEGIHSALEKSAC